MTSLAPTAEPDRVIDRAPVTGASAASAAKPRLDWVDGCKGICIILVVYGHVAGGLTTSGTVEYGSALDRLRSWVYLFHMPAFFFLSGLFAANALKRPFADFVTGRVRTLAYPYVLWTGIYLLVQEMMARFANTPPDAGAALEFLWKPYGYGLWFLYSLFLISFLFHFARSMHVPRMVVLILAVALHIAAPLGVFSFWPILGLASLNFVFYAVGGLYAGEVFAWLSTGARAVWLIAGLSSLAAMTALSWVPGSFHAPFDLLVAFLGVAGAIGVARAVARSLPGKFFSLLGLFSLEIYLGHPLFSTAARALLTHAGIHRAIPLLAACVGAGIFVSLALALVCQKAGFPWLYRWPAPQRSPNP